MATYVDWFAGLLFLFNTTNSHRVGPHESTHILWVLENRKERERKRERERENKESKKTKKSCSFFETFVRSFSFRFILNFFFLLLLLLYYYKIIFPKSPDSLAFFFCLSLSFFIWPAHFRSMTRACIDLLPELSDSSTRMTSTPCENSIRSVDCNRLD